ncbi:acetyltransferase [Paenibacillus sp. CH40]|uniref:acetyltransferase n=1 Tax=Paenibacillus sp. CH40 TaxID=2962045 RepID=UPI0020B6E61D|nr:acetyltransferase [Paenibacillus sp. CH40]MCP3792989.1 acetyltransferase [Paenibacillus sp. CH40]
MIELLVPNDDILNQNQFLADEVRYNLIHRICESEGSTCLKTSDKNMIFAQSPRHKAWLWSSQQITDNHKLTYIEELLRYLKGTTLSGVCGDAKTVEKFANAYAQRHAAQVHTHMVMESYFCPKYKKPSGVEGMIRQSITEDVQLVAQFLAGFSEEALGSSIDPVSQISVAEKTIRTGNLYLWIVNNMPVSMANIAHSNQTRPAMLSIAGPPLHLSMHFTP